MLDLTKQLLDLTQQIQDSANLTEWEKVADLQEAREDITRQIESSAAPQDEKTSREIEAVVIEIQKIDAQIMPKVIEQMRSLNKNRKQTNQGKKMTKAYQST